MHDRATRFRVAEFFAGIGLVRMGLAPCGFGVAWANDISPLKARMYAAQFGGADFDLRDVREVRGDELPEVALATASFPCTDLSLAGNRLGLSGTHSSTFWEFTRILSEMGWRRPQALLIENVTGFVTSHGGDDLRVALAELNDLGYWCDLLTIDARHFVPQSRPRLFIVASQAPLAEPGEWCRSPLRSSAVIRFVEANAQAPLGRQLLLNPLPLPPLPDNDQMLVDVVERLPKDDRRWWDAESQARFIGQLTPLQLARLDAMRISGSLSWATAYRRTRRGAPAWEIREDAISGCLRAVSGGSSKQALVEAGGGEVGVRWMTAREYARLQGAPDYRLTPDVTEAQGLFAFGDAVCVPAISWLGEHYLRPLLRGELTRAPAARELVGA